MTQKTFMFAPSVMVRVLYWKLRDLDQALSNNFRHNVISVEARERL